MSTPNDSSVSSERSFFRRLTSETLKRDCVEARDHPGEQPLHAVHPRAFPAEVIADLQDVQFPHPGRDRRRRGPDAAACPRWPTTAPACRRRSRAPGPSLRTTAPAPTTAPSPMRHAVEDLGPRAEPRARADGHALGSPALRRAPARRIAEVVIAANQVAVGRQQRVATDSHAAGGEQFAVEADVRAVRRSRCRRSCTTGSCSGR